MLLLLLFSLFGKTMMQIESLAQPENERKIQNKLDFIIISRKNENFYGIVDG